MSFRICAKFCSKFYCLKSCHSISKGERKRESENSPLAACCKPAGQSGSITPSRHRVLQGTARKGVGGVTLACNPVCRAREKFPQTYPDHCLLL